jgi:uncharacterized protein
MSAGKRRTRRYPSLKGTVRGLFLQSTTFCNLDCRYCYWPDRKVKNVMSPEVVGALFRRLAQEDLLDDSISPIWHMGEPLAIPVSHYRRYDEQIDRWVPPGVRVDRVWQTNATLVNQMWCDYFKQCNAANVGVSIDGPAFLHDVERKDTRGRDSHQRVLDGIKRLQDNDIPTSAICVVTPAHLAHAEEVYAFFRDLGIASVALNYERKIGLNAGPYSDPEQEVEQFERFMAHIYRRNQADGEKLGIVNFEAAEALVDSNAGMTTSSIPCYYMGVATNGEFSTFNPDMVGEEAFRLGNVLTDSISDSLASPKAILVGALVAAGARQCQRVCAFFDTCGGGQPREKLSENGSIASTETVRCRTYIQVPVNVVRASRGLSPLPRPLPIRDEALNRASVQAVQLLKTTRVLDARKAKTTQPSDAQWPGAAAEG